MRKLLLQIIIYLMLPAIGISQSTFEGATSADWTVASNWNPAVVPGSGADITIDTSGGGNNPIIPTGNYSYATITIDTGSELTISTRAIVTVTGAQISNLGKLYVSGQLLGTGANTILRNGTTSPTSTYEVFFYAGSVLNISGKLINYEGSVNSNNSTITVAGIDNSASWALRYSNITFDNNSTVACSGDVTNNYGTISLNNSIITAKALINKANDATYDQVINLNTSTLTLTGSVGVTAYSVSNSGIFNIDGTSTIDPGTNYFRIEEDSEMNIITGSTLTFTQNNLWNFGILKIDGNLSGTFTLSNGSRYAASGITNINSTSTLNLDGLIYNRWGTINIDGTVIGSYDVYNGDLVNPTYTGTININNGSTITTSKDISNFIGSININTPTSFSASKLINSDGQTVTFTSTNATIYDNISNEGIIEVKSNSTINSVNDISVGNSGSYNIEAGSSTVTSSGQFVLLNSSSILNNHGSVSASGYINNAGTINLFGNSSTTGSTVNNKLNATINFQAVNSITGNFINQNGGLLSTTHGSIIVISGNFTNKANLSSTFIGGSGKSVIITVGGNFYNSTIDSKFNIESSKMSIGGTFNNEGHFTLESSASATSSLKVGGGATNTGTINIQRYLHDDGSGSGKWQLVSSPVSTEESGIFTGHFLNKYSETSGEFEGLSSKVEPLVVGEGYISKLDFNNTDGDGVSDMSNPIVYSNSTLNTDDVSLTLEVTDDEDGTLSNTYFDFPIGFHLVGNPYTSNIDWDNIYNEGTNGTNITKFLYYYVDDGNGVPADPENPIAHNGKNGWQVYEGGTTGAQSIIAMGQGFGVVMADNLSSKAFTIPKTSKTHTAGTFNKKGNSETNSFVLNAVSNNVIDDIKFRFNERASRNYDVEYDAYKLKSFGTSPTTYFVADDGVKLAICEMPFSETIDLGFSMSESGEVTFSLNNVNDFSEIVLEDKVEGKFTDLLKNTYSFNYSTDESETGRFKLHFKQEALSEVDYLSDLDIYSNQGTIYINNNKKLTNVELKIYSISGQLVYSNNYSDLTNKEIQTSLKGVYILKLNSNEGVTTSKISLK